MALCIDENDPSGRYDLVTLRTYRGDPVSFDERDVAEALARLQSETWRYIVERLEIRRFLSVARAAEVDKMLEKGPWPEITEATVRSFAEHYMGRMDEMLREAVGEVFELLRPRGHTRDGHLKTNTEFEVPKRVMLTVLEYNGAHVSHYWSKHIRALENVFLALDGRGQMSRGYNSELSEAIHAARGGSGETDLFKFKCHKNNRLHLEFKRLDLLKRFNQIAGGRRLRVAAA